MKLLKPNSKQIKNKYSLLVIIGLTVVISMLLFTGCKSDNDDDPVPTIAYSDAENWVSISDTEKSVDVFYVYPTVSSNASGAMDINNSDERVLAIGIYKAQASVFEPYANVFAPYYRQMSTNVDMSGGGLATDTPEFKLGAVDVQQAFDYYIENLNNGRPYMLAGHSQGTMALIELIKKRFVDNPELSERLVAAYLIGYTVTNGDLFSTGLSFAQNATDIGVVVVY